MDIDCAFPGGNILVERTEGDRVFVRQDLRDTEGDWFYWAFRVRGAGGRRLAFTFTGSNVLGVRGPALSRDGGATWAWLGADAVRDAGFSHTFGPDEAETRFAFGIAYQEAHLRAFLARHARNPALRTDLLCRTQKKREVELLHAGRVDGQAAHRALLTARHHSCEAVPNYVLEGLQEEVIAGTESGPWLREHVEFLVVPFMDKDGVEDGDQGKNRRPHDHNRDYAGTSIYSSVRALRAFIPELCGGRLRFVLDLHCPWIRGKHNEDVYFVGSADPGNWARASTFANLLEAAMRGPLPYRTVHNLPFGQAWNTLSGPARSCARWGAELPGVAFGTTLEVPYAACGGVTVSAENARLLGRDLARATETFFKQSR